jgi:uncharacterized protein YpuA (DUF1002 family)
VLSKKFGINFDDKKAKEEIKKMEDTLGKIIKGVEANTDAISKLRNLDNKIINALMDVNKLFEDKNE